MVTSAKSMNDRPRFALRFISGKYQGGEFPLRMNREIIIGRSSDLDMVLVEDMVSRRHAKISSTEAEVYIQDMGSTNGTFVNSERITSQRLSDGDRITVGRTSVIYRAGRR
jgi:pSer/pThr/pTyr-binding forkhead associated (FHA) protein